MPKLEKAGFQLVLWMNNCSTVTWSEKQVFVLAPRLVYKRVSQVKSYLAAV